MMQHSLPSADASTGPEGTLGIYSIKLQPVALPSMSSHSFYFLVFLSPLACPTPLRQSATHLAFIPSHPPDFDALIEVPAQECTLSSPGRRLRGAESLGHVEISE
jgi:hypothetical protein